MCRLPGCLGGCAGIRERRSCCPLRPSRTPVTMTRQLRTELFIALGCIAFSLLLLPALIYWVGTLILDPYSGGPLMTSLYGDFFRALTEGSFAAWLLVAGPYILLTLLRLIFTRHRAADDDDEPVAPRKGRAPRVEPNISS